MTNRILFARQCSITGEGMNEGWVGGFFGGMYFKYEQDALKWCQSKGYKDIDDAYDNEALYYTEWEDADDYEYELVDGKLIEL